MLFRSLLMLVLLALAPAVSAKSVPLPMEKPGAAGEKEPAAGEDQAAAGEDEVDTASDSCGRALAAAGVVAEPAAAFAGDEQCILEDPVALEAVGAHTGNVGLPGGPTLECRFAAVFGDWLREVVNPVAASLLGSHVDAVVTGPGHQCRRRAGAGTLSEHGLGNAIDITAIRLIDGRSILIEDLVNAVGPEREFLRAISASACGYFTTVLGPGSDDAHADHLHVDMAERRTVEYRICMAR